MQKYTFSTFSDILHILPLQQVSDQFIEYILTDSRRLLIPSASVFFAISSKHINANRFISSLYEKGVRAFVVTGLTKTDIVSYPAANFLVVDSVLQALQKIAAYHRNLFSFPVIGITGSNGKTIVKEWLNHLLHQHYNIVRSPKSFNSQLGVPLSVWQMSEGYNLGIFEAGISQPGEMKMLEQIINPDIGVYTFTGEAHSSGFKTIEEKVNEKLLLFRNSKVLIFCSDDNILQTAIPVFKKKINNNLVLFSWGTKEGSVLQVLSVSISGSSSIIECNYDGNIFSFTIPFTDKASIHNAMVCVSVMLFLQVPVFEIISLTTDLRPVEMRLELKQGINNCSIINDSYSSDINSLVIALDFLFQQQQHKDKTLILSDMLQTGLQPDVLYKKIAEILKQRKLSRFIGIGTALFAHKEYFNELKDTYFFGSTDEFITNINTIKFQDQSILLKGARLFSFEKISHAFEEKKHETVLEINLNALHHNLNFYRRQLAPGVKLMAMVKAFSYGSGSFEIANVMQHAGVDYLAVAYVDEGVELRQGGIRLPIMVINIEEAGFENLIKYDLEPELYSFKITRSFIQFLKERDQQKFPVHIKLDTGMHRLGFEQQDLVELSKLLKDHPELHVISVFSHLAASQDAMHDAFTRQQADIFDHISTSVEQVLGYSFIKHISNSSAIHRHPSLQYDMVRLGIGLYGVDSEPQIQHQLLNVTSLKTTISQIKKVAKGDSVGYSRQAIVSAETMIATVRLGYADGYPRVLGNGKGKMLVNGKLAPVIGNVCMDMTMLDISGIEVLEGDEVTAFGEYLPVAQLAEWAGTIPYEILTGISQRVRRVYFEE